jgi:hypothetical protein
MADKQTISGLLNQLVASRPHLTWKLNCSYHDGINEPVFELAIRRKYGSGGLKSVVFQMESGRVLHCRGKGISLSPDDTIIDVLLDMINYEKALEA